jgi:hypothetical protein
MHNIINSTIHYLFYTNLSSQNAFGFTCFTIYKQQTSHIENNTQTNLDLQNTALGYGFHFQHRHSRTFPSESLAYNTGRTLVCAKYSYLKAPQNTSAHPNDLIVNLMKLPDNGRLRRHLPNDLLPDS